MVLCKFFLQGNCRFGENCKFEHQYTDNRQPHASIIRQQTFNPSTNNPTTANSVDTATLIRSVTNDMNTVEKKGQWLLSCYAPFKEKSVFPGFEDHSFEEIRYGYYTAKANGTLDIYCQQLNALLQEAAMKVKSLQNPTPEAVAIMRKIYDEPVQFASSSFTNKPQSVFDNNQNNVFGGAATNTSIFGQPTNVGTPNIFSKDNQSQNTTPKSIFAAANQSLFGVPQQSIFSNPNQSIFGNTQQINKPFGQPVPAETPSGFQPNQTTAFKPGGFMNAPFSTNSNALPFSASTQNSSFVTAQPKLGASIFNTQPSGNSPLVPQNTNTSFNSQNTPFNTSNSTFSNIQQTQSTLSSSQGTNIFNSNVTAPRFNMNPVGVIDESIYSKPEDLSESDIKSYQAEAFEFGKVPEKPPHISMC